MGSVQELLELHERVKSSGCPNYMGVRVPVRSRWNVQYMEQALDDYDDKMVVTFCRFGWPIGLIGDEIQGPREARNHRGATEFADQLDQYIARELEEGTLLGPFSESPFISPIWVSPLNTTDKRDSPDRRVIMDLSFPPGNSINDRIPKDSYLGEEISLRYPSVDALTELVREKGRGCALMKSDLKRAYKQIFVDPGDWNFLGMRWKGLLYFDMTMPMGLRSSAMCCQRITNAVKHIMRSKGFGLVAYLDDMVSAEVWEHAQDCFIALRETLWLMGGVEAEHKSVSPSTKMVFLGVLFDTEKLTLEVSRERVDECMNMLDEWLDKREVRRKEIESLVGKLAFMAACVRPGRLFMSRVLEFLKGLPKVGKVEVPESVRRDLLWWKVFLPQYNGVSMMPWQKWSAPDEVVATDACLQGCGAWFNSHQEFFHAQFPESVTCRNLSINALELLTVVVAAKVWGKLWHGLRIVIQCDNETSVTVLNTGRTHNSFLQGCLRELELVAARCEFEIRAVHIKGVDNRIPDALSRWEAGGGAEAALQRTDCWNGGDGEICL